MRKKPALCLSTVTPVLTLQLKNQSAQEKQNIQYVLYLVPC